MEVLTFDIAIVKCVQILYLATEPGLGILCFCLVGEVEITDPIIVIWQLILWIQQLVIHRSSTLTYKLLFHYAYSYLALAGFFSNRL